MGKVKLVYGTVPYLYTTTPKLIYGSIPFVTAPLSSSPFTPTPPPTPGAINSFGGVSWASINTLSGITKASIVSVSGVSVT